MSIITELENFSPLHSFHLGHTPFQIEHFKTTSQKGSRKFEYWQHVVQLKSLWGTLKELELDIDDQRYEIEVLSAWFPFWTKSARRRKIPRAKHKLSRLEQSFQEKSLEASRHLEVIQTKYGDLTGLTEAEILADEESYWITRLSRQIAFSALAARSAVNVGDLSAIASLPDALQGKVYQAVRQVLAEHAKLEGQHGNTTARLQQSPHTGKPGGDLPPAGD